MEENIAKFGEKLKQLVAHGKKNKSILELQKSMIFLRYGDNLMQNRWRKFILKYLDLQTIILMCFSCKRRWGWN